jgi:hypothetical protein
MITLSLFSKISSRMTLTFTKPSGGDVAEVSRQNKGTLIEIRVRPQDNRDTFLPLYELLNTRYHELAYCSFSSRKDSFFRDWKSIMEEVDEDLGNTVSFRNAPEWCQYKKVMDDLEADADLRAAARSRARAGRRGIGDAKAILAAKLWEELADADYELEPEDWD